MPFLPPNQQCQSTEGYRATHGSNRLVVAALPGGRNAVEDEFADHAVVEPPAVAHRQRQRQGGDRVGPGAVGSVKPAVDAVLERHRVDGQHAGRAGRRDRQDPHQRPAARRPVVPDRRERVELDQRAPAEPEPAAVGARPAPGEDLRRTAGLVRLDHGRGRVRVGAVPLGRRRRRRGGARRGDAPTRGAPPPGCKPAPALGGRGGDLHLRGATTPGDVITRCIVGPLDMTTYGNFRDDSEDPEHRQYHGSGYRYTALQ